uniref:NADH dehydrogenase subunit 2 n=1 Tax=Caenorhabditis macrosperma TaxID=1094328 RepID=A0A1Z1GDK1_9PELO|nr:NADH dehydrogenase subunit 2 [Caenorhabditis macrosperma]ARV88334.1 NADH dehydrogenase subunit 2 [Caenorhabditis macrosperma]
MIIFISLFTLFLTLLSILTNNVIVWWSIFLLMTVVFTLLNKSSKSYTSIFNYFVIQESLGLLFLVFSSGFLQFFIILMKIGVAPLHFWIFNVTNNIFNYSLMWFLTFQKLPFLTILLQIFWLSSSYILLFGLLICYLQIFVMKSYKNLLIISSTESFNWIVLGVFFSIFNSLYLFIYYFILMVLLISKFSKSSGYNFINWETVLVFLNIPFSVSFFVKIFSLSEIFKVDSFFTLFLLFVMFLSVLAFSFWLINLSMKNNEESSSNNKMNYFLLFPLMMVSII